MQKYVDISVLPIDSGTRALDSSSESLSLDRASRKAAGKPSRPSGHGLGYFVFKALADVSENAIAKYNTVHYLYPSEGVALRARRASFFFDLPGSSVPRPVAFLAAKEIS